MLLKCPNTIILMISPFLDILSRLYFKITTNFNKPAIMQTLFKYLKLQEQHDKKMKSIRFDKCLEGACFNGRKDLCILFWKYSSASDPFSTVYSSLRGACKGKQLVCVNWILKKPIETVFYSELFYIVLKSHSDAIVCCFLSNVKIINISTIEWSHLWNASQKDSFCRRWMNFIFEFKKFNKERQFTTPEAMFAPCYYI